MHNSAMHCSVLKWPSQQSSFVSLQSRQRVWMEVAFRLFDLPQGLTRLGQPLANVRSPFPVVSQESSMSQRDWDTPVCWGGRPRGILCQGLVVNIRT